MLNMVNLLNGNKYGIGEDIYHMNIKRHAKNIKTNVDDVGKKESSNVFQNFMNTINSVAKKIIKNGGNAVSTLLQSTSVTTTKVIQGGSDTVTKIVKSGANVITAPVAWLKNIQKNLIVYLTLIAIILLSIIFLYFLIRYQFYHKNNNWSTSNLLELTKIIINNNATLQQQQPRPFDPMIYQHLHKKIPDFPV